MPKRRDKRQERISNRPAKQSREVSQTRADQILQRPASAAEERFALFYRGLIPEDLAQAMGQ